MALGIIEGLPSRPNRGRPTAWTLLLHLLHLPSFPTTGAGGGRGSRPPPDHRASGPPDGGPGPRPPGRCADRRPRRRRRPAAAASGSVNGRGGAWVAAYRAAGSEPLAKSVPNQEGTSFCWAVLWRQLSSSRRHLSRAPSRDGHARAAPGPAAPQQQRSERHVCQLQRRRGGGGAGCGGWAESACQPGTRLAPALRPAVAGEPCCTVCAGAVCWWV